MKVRRNDTVLVIAGKSRGKQGKVHCVLPKEKRVLVEGVNLIKRHTKARPNVRQAGIVEREAPVSSNIVMLVCTKCQKPTRVGYRFLETGAKVRVCKRCNEEID